MTKKPPHNRKLALLGVAMTAARNPKDSMRALGEARDQLEALLVSEGFFDGAPFSWATLSIRYGLKDEREPHYEEINASYGDLPLAIEVDCREFKGAGLQKLQKLFERSALLALIHAGKRYDRPVEALEARLLSLE